MAQGDVYNVAMKFEHVLAPEPMLFTIDFAMVLENTPQTETEYMQALGDEINAIILTTYLSLITTSFTHAVTEIYNRTQPQFGLILNAGNAGLVVGDACPLRDTVLVSKQTGFRGRSFTGRMNLMSPPEAEQNSGQLRAPYITSLAAFTDALLEVDDGVTGNTWQAVVWSRTLQVATPITEFVVRPFTKTQQGRQ